MFLKIILFNLLVLAATSLVSAQPKTYALLSTRLVQTVRSGKDYAKMLDSLAQVPQDYLAKELDSDAVKKTFWINVYNAHIQILLTQDPTLFDHRSDFFKTPSIKVAGETLSFDKVEHGIIRRSKAKLGLGILPKLGAGKFEKAFRVKKTDPRIHLALNCGAKSCPPVAAYDYRRFDAQIDQSTRLLLAKTTHFDQQKNTVEVITLFSWFRGDWGGKGKVLRFLKKYEALPQEAKPTIRYSDYDWTLLTGKYVDL